MKLAFVGGGKMAEAMIGAVLRARLARPGDVCVSDIAPTRRRHLARRYDIGCTASNAEAIQRARTVVLAVKPQQLDAVLAELAPSARSSHLFLSIAAGKRIETIEALVPRARVVRVMPNVACLVSEAMSAFCLGTRARPSDRTTALRLLSAFGRAEEVPERLFDVVTALSGSGPAFFALLLLRLAEGAEAQGLPGPQARSFARQTLLGTARLLHEHDLSPESLIAMVSSPGGTTVDGLGVLDRPATAALLRDTIAAAARRGRELSRLTNAH